MLGLEPQDKIDLTLWYQSIINCQVKSLKKKIIQKYGPSVPEEYSWKLIKDSTKKKLQEGNYFGPPNIRDGKIEILHKLEQQKN